MNQILQPWALVKTWLDVIQQDVIQQDVIQQDVIQQDEILAPIKQKCIKMLCRVSFVMEMNIRSYPL